MVQIPSPALVCDGGQGWVFDKSPQQLPGPPANGDLEAWAAANCGIPASANYITVTLQGINGHNILVHEIQVRVWSRSEPPHGAYPGLTGGCGGYLPYRFSIDLDATSSSPGNVLPASAVTAKPDEDSSAACRAVCRGW